MGCIRRKLPKPRPKTEWSAEPDRSGALFEAINLDCLSVDAEDYEIAAGVLGMLARYASAQSVAYRLRAGSARDGRRVTDLDREMANLYRCLPPWARW